MQFVNDDMDDELFRRAAEEYPLNTEKGDWNELLDKMQSAGVNLPQKKRNRRGLLLFFALIPLLLICTTYIKNDRAADNIALVNKNTPTDPQPSSNKDVTIYNNKNKPSNKIANGDEQLNDDKKEVATVILPKEISSSSKMKQTPHSNLKNRTNNDVAVTGNTDKNLLTRTKNISDGKNSDSKINPVGEGESSPRQTIPLDNKSVTNNSNVAADNTTTEKQADKTKKEDSINTTLKTPATKTQKEKAKEAKFYFGFQAGPDFSMVKSTNTDGMGYGFGLVAGYNLSKKFAVESGVLWDHKKYVSEGQYFKTDKLNLPPHVTIYDLSGYCEMFEIPLNLRYNISANSNRTWFANAGLSSYIMKTENYDYYYERYGVYQTGNKEYKNTTTNWLSVAHVSIGLQKKLGRVGDLRIEPYVKLPINGVGIGSLPLSSTGIYLGITRPIR